MTKIKQMSVLFPVFGSYPCVLNYGVSDEVKRNVDGKKILFVLDNTGSMGEYINEKGECSKAVMAKKLIDSVMSKRSTNDYDIMCFNVAPSPLCKLGDVPQPSNSTYFTPLVPELGKYITNSHEYCSVVFLSDGLPSEDRELAREAIRTLGNITREGSANPVAVAVGTDADGKACSLFAGNRGYNCYIKYNQDLEDTVKDVCNSIDCNYVQLENGSYIPVESDGKFYHIGTETLSETEKPTKYHVEKFLNLVVQKYINDTNEYTNLKSYIQHVSKLLDSEEEQTEVVNKFGSMLDVIRKTVLHSAVTPAALSAVATCYRQVSGGQV